MHAHRRAMMKSTEGCDAVSDCDGLIGMLVHRLISGLGDFDGLRSDVARDFPATFQVTCDPGRNDAEVVAQILENTLREISQVKQGGRAIRCVGRSTAQ